MALRLIEVVVEGYDEQSLRDALEECRIHSVWFAPQSEDRIGARVLVDAEYTEKILDMLEERFCDDGKVTAVVLSVDAAVPRPDREDNQNESAANEPTGRERTRIDKHEVLEEVETEIRFTLPFFLLCILSTVVAAMGLYTNSAAVIIGAMVIAPLSGPSLGLGLAATMGHGRLALRAGALYGAAIVACIGIAVLLGLFLEVDPTAEEFRSRTRVSYTDIVVALAAGTAGVIGVTTRAHAALVGVMIAVALIPAMAALGLLLGQGMFGEAKSSGLLLAANIIGINLASVATLALQGFRPTTWREQGQARVATAVSVLVWILLLGGLVVIMLYS